MAQGTSLDLEDPEAGPEREESPPSQMAAAGLLGSLSCGDSVSFPLGLQLRLCTAGIVHTGSALSTAAAPPGSHCSPTDADSSHPPGAEPGEA